MCQVKKGIVAKSSVVSRLWDMISSAEANLEEITLYLSDQR